MTTSGVRHPRLRASADSEAIYHVSSRIVDGSVRLDAKEQRYFEELARAGAEFGGLELVSVSVDESEFNLVVRIPPMDPNEVDDEVVLDRLEKIYPLAKAHAIRYRWEYCKTDEARRRLLDPHRQRMGDLSDYVKLVKQRFTQWLNSQRGRRGTLWEGRFRSMLVVRGDS